MLLPPASALKMAPSSRAALTFASPGRRPTATPKTWKHLWPAPLAPASATSSRRRREPYRRPCVPARQHDYPQSGAYQAPEIFWERQLALGTWHLALGTWHLALGTWHLAFGTWHLAFGC